MLPLAGYAPAPNHPVSGIIAKHLVLLPWQNLPSVIKLRASQCYQIQIQSVGGSDRIESASSLFDFALFTCLCLVLFYTRLGLLRCFHVSRRLHLLGSRSLDCFVPMLDS